jgi:O-antigen/teichoic acid export membrane protein
MSRLGVNLLANVAGAGWAGLVQLVCVPLYVKFLGIEAYGLVGFYLALQTTLRILDLGLAPTMTREMARYSVQPGNIAEMRNFARTIELVYWAIGISVGMALCAMAGVIATKWINPGTLPPAEVKRSLLIVGAVTAVQWPLSVYQGGLTGLQRLPLLNVIRVIGATVSGLAAILVLWLVSSSIAMFFLAQLLVGAAQTAVTAVAFWKCLPGSAYPARIDVGSILKIGRFVGGMGGIGIFGLILTQMDKIVVSRMLPLDEFGYYSLAASVSNALQLFTLPLFGVLFPGLATLVATGDERALCKLYHNASQVMNLLITPCAIVIVLFAVPAMLAWTGDMNTARKVAPVVALLAAGTALNGISHLPYALQLAYGWTEVALWTTVSMCLVFVPMLYVAVSHYGAVGAALVWLLLNIMNLATSIPVTHYRLLRGEAWRWVLKDVGLPALAAAAAVAAARILLGVAQSRGMAALDTALALALAVCAATLCAGRVRGQLLDWGRRIADI